MRIDRDLEQRFDALRLADRAAAPDFDAVVRRRAMLRRPVAFRVALVAATVLVAVVGVRLATRQPRTDTPTVLTWRSPTATLLETPGQGLLYDIPNLRSSVLSDRSQSGGR